MTQATINTTFNGKQYRFSIGNAVLAIRDKKGVWTRKPISLDTQPDSRLNEFVQALSSNGWRPSTTFTVPASISPPSYYQWLSDGWIYYIQLAQQFRYRPADSEVRRNIIRSILKKLTQQ